MNGPKGIMDGKVVLVTGESGFGRLAPSFRNWMKACRYTRDGTEMLTEMRGHNLNGRVRKLSRVALAFRAFHGVIAVEMLLAIAYVWWCALSGRRDRLLRIAAASLIGEGVLVAANHGDCPLGGLQERLGDPVPLFELVLSARAAKRAVPTLGAITAAGLVLLAVRGPSDARQEVK
jgi:hypothetical protein